MMQTCYAHAVSIIRARSQILVLGLSGRAAEAGWRRRAQDLGGKI